MSETKAKEEKAKELELSEKKDSPENKAIRASQVKAGKIKLTDRKEVEIIKDCKHFKKGDKVKLGLATYEVFKAKGLVK